MYRLKAIKSEKVWGYELWIASTHPNGLQEDFKEYAGGDYPLLVKIIQADDTLSVQVHPDDELAQKFEGGSGKTECWFILGANKDARLIYGMDGEHSEEELRAAINENRLEDFMNSVPVKKGDFAYIPAGTVHAIGGGLRILEVQQSSDITYRLYDWGRGRECHVDKGIACIKNQQSRKVESFRGAFSCPYFTLEEIFVDGKFTAPVSVRTESQDPADTVLYFVIEGSGLLNDRRAAAEEIFAFGPNERIVAEGKFLLMRIAAAI